MVFDPEFTKVLEDLEKKKPENQRHQELIGLVKDLLNVMQDVKKASSDQSSLQAILGKLESILTKDDPELPDGSNVVAAVGSLTSELKSELGSVSDQLKALKLDPQINVAAPNVQVAAPSVKVDAPKLDPLFKKLETSLNTTLNKLMEAMPESTDIGPLEELFKQNLSKLDDIDMGVRLKPAFPNTLKVTNTDGSKISGLTPVTDYNNILVTNTSVTTDTVQFKLSGSTVRTLAVTYPNSTVTKISDQLTSVDLS